MPQMAPLWWEILFLIFFLTFLMFNMIMYFNEKKILNKKNINKNKLLYQCNWMW